MSDYMSVGELAELVGVSVRSIQYYDQQGILSPSAKGPQNQRLYASADVERLYCILCLKYVGLSLAQVKECLAQGITIEGARRIFLDALRETEKSFSNLLGRYATLCGLVEAVGAEVPVGDLELDDRSHAVAEGADMHVAPESTPYWCSLARSIERYRTGEKYFWRISCVRDGHGDASKHERESSEKGRVVAAWHGLISDVLANMAAEEPLDSEGSQALARRYLRLQAEGSLCSGGQAFMLLENAPVPHAPDDASFDAMRHSVSNRLDCLAARYRELHPTQ